MEIQTNSEESKQTQAQHDVCEKRIAFATLRAVGLGAITVRIRALSPTRTKKARGNAPKVLTKSGSGKRAHASARTGRSGLATFARVQSLYTMYFSKRWHAEAQKMLTRTTPT
jgi:hypothetical protein